MIQDNLQLLTTVSHPVLLSMSVIMGWALRTLTIMILNKATVPGPKELEANAVRGPRQKS